MEITRELLLSVRTTMEVKGPYKLQLSKNDLVVSTIKIRMRDDVTHIVHLSHGDYIIKVLKNDKEHLINSLSLPNFENGSQVRVIINDTGIELSLDGVIRYKTVDEYMDIINEPAKQKKEKKPKKPIEIKTSVVSNNTNSITTSAKSPKSNNILIQNNSDKKNNHLKHNNINHNHTTHSNNNNNTFDSSKYVSKEEIDLKIEKLTQVFNEKISTMQKEIEELKSQINLNKNNNNSNEVARDVENTNENNYNEEIAA